MAQCPPLNTLLNRDVNVFSCTFRVIVINAFEILILATEVAFTSHVKMTNENLCSPTPHVQFLSA